MRLRSRPPLSSAETGRSRCCPRTAPRRVRELVRLHQADVSTRQIGIAGQVAASTVRLALRRVTAAGMTAGILADQTDAAPETVAAALPSPTAGCPRCSNLPLPC